MPILMSSNFESTSLGRFTITYLTLPNLTGKWSYGLLHLTWQGPGKWSYVEVAENSILCLLLGFEVKKGVVSGVRA